STVSVSDKPETLGDALIVVVVFVSTVRDAVGKARDASYRYGIDALETFQCLGVEPGKQGRLHQTSFPPNRHSGLIECSPISGVCYRPVVVVLHIVFPRPDDMDGPAHRFGNFYCFRDVVSFAASSKATANDSGVDLDAIGST